MYTREQLGKILILDIETVSVAPSYSQLPVRMQELWDKKAALLQKREEVEIGPEQLYSDRAAIFAEFGKVVCISLGFISFEGDEPSLKLRSFFGEDEKTILSECTKVLDATMGKPGWQLAAHNGKEFDFPYMGRRYVINQLPLPKILAEIQSAKPWEVRLIDTMNLWKFGDFKSFSSLDLLCGVLDIPSPKDDMDGSMVGKVFWEEKDYARIAKYCEQDVIATAQVLLRFSMEKIISPGNMNR